MAVCFEAPPNYTSSVIIILFNCWSLFIVYAPDNFCILVITLPFVVESNERIYADKTGKVDVVLDNHNVTASKVRSQRPAGVRHEQHLYANSVKDADMKRYLCVHTLQWLQSINQILLQTTRL